MKTSVQYMLFFLAALVLHSCSDELSVDQKESFIKFYGSYKNDVGLDVKVLSSGGYALTGSMELDYSSRMFLIITDEYGNQTASSPTFYGDTASVGRSLLSLGSEGFIIAGQILDTLADGTSHSDIFLVRTDSIGGEIWSKRLGGDSNETAYHIANRASGGFVIAGKKEVDGQDDLWIIMVDENGEKIFEFTGNNDVDDDEARFILNTGSGYLVACAYNDGAFNGNESDMMVLNLDESCNFYDARAMGEHLIADHPREIVNYDGAYLIVGYTQDATGHTEIGLHKFSLDGDLIKIDNEFATIAHGDADYIGEGCVVSSNGNIAVVGSREDAEGKRMLLQIVDAEGTFEDPILFGEQGSQSASSIRQTHDGGLVFTGFNELGGNSVISLVKTDASGKF